MVVTQFAFDPAGRRGPHRFENHERTAVAYTGTHDNAPLAGWWASASEHERSEAYLACERVGVREPEPHWALIDLTLRSRAAVAILQAQDVLGLGDEARMNMPGVEGGPNWRWQLQPGQLTREHAKRLRRLTEAARR
jgi:4-alpha-glucanotransferase